MIDIARFFVPFMAPLPLGLFCIILGFFCLLLRRNKMAIAGIALGLGVLLFFGYGIGTRQQLYALERQYSMLDLNALPEELRQQIHFVVVLGSGHASDPEIAETAQISGASLYRLVEGIRLQRQLPRTKLVISGGINQDPRPNAVVVSHVAELLGIDPETMVIEESPRDTYEEAQLLRPLLGKEPFILVTSAAHMVRAMRLFTDAEMHPIAAPTDYILKTFSPLSGGSFLPSCSHLEISKRIIYEWLGTLWGYLKQKTA